jgi:hypothetical protein
MRLVKRFKRMSKKPQYKGVDAFTDWDYMGSSEFEGNVLFQAMSRLRASTCLEAYTLEHEGVKLYVISEPQWQGNLTDTLNRKDYLERTDFPWHHVKSRWAGDVVNTTGWFFLDPPEGGTPFVVFTDKVLARWWRQSLGMSKK